MLIVRDQRSEVRKARGVKVEGSHPFAIKKAKGWGTEYWSEDESGTSSVRAIPGLLL
jgi:hypothetical protein